MAVADSAETLAEEFHTRYESLAPVFDYETREASAVPWKDVPRQNKLLMIEVCRPLAERLQRTRQALEQSQQHSAALEVEMIRQRDRLIAANRAAETRSPRSQM